MQPPLPLRCDVCVCVAWRSVDECQTETGQSAVYVRTCVECEHAGHATMYEQQQTGWPAFTSTVASCFFDEMRMRGYFGYN